MSSAVSAAVFREAMVTAYREKSGFIPEDASDLGLRLSVLARQLENLSEAVGTAERNAFPQTAVGGALEFLAGARNLIRRPALAAGGELRFSRFGPTGEDVVIPAGTICAGPGEVRFQIAAEAVLPASETSVLVPAVATVPGQAGNVPALSVRVIISGLAGISSVTNPAPFAGGVDEEDDESLRGRLLSHMSDPPGSFNAAFYRQAALGFPGVASAQVLPMRRGIGTVDVFISALPGQNASALADGLRGVLSQAREIGVDVDVFPAVPRPIELVCIVRTARGFSSPKVLDACRGALAGVIASLSVGHGLAVARLKAALMGVEGVENVRLISPANDIEAQEGQILAISEIEVVEGTLDMPEVSAG